MHVIFQGTRFTGGRMVLLDHALALAKQGWDVRVWMVNARGAVPAWAAGDVPVRPLDQWSQLPAADGILVERPSLVPRAVLNARGAKVIQFVQGYEGDDIQILMTDGLKRKTPAGWWWAARCWLRLKTIERAYHLPAAKLVVHEHLRQLIRDRYQQEALLVPNGLPEGVYTPAKDRQWSGRRALVVGPTDTPSKQVIDALRAIKILKGRMEGVTLVRIAQHSMRAVEEAMGVTDEYHTMLDAAGMSRVYQSCDLLLLPYNHAEGFGLPAVEAMACGLPVVLTDIPAFRTFDEPADYASFVPVGDSSAMARAAEDLLKDPALRQTRSARGLAVAGKYTRAASHRAMAEALGKCLG